MISSRGHSRGRKIRIDDALGGATRCRRVALRQRRVAAFVIVGAPAVYVQANGISRIVRLGPSWCCRQNCRGRQNRQSRNAHQSLLRECAARHSVRAPNAFRIASCAPASAGVSDCKQTGAFVPGQFTFARWRALGTGLGGSMSNVRHVHEYFIGAVYVEYLAAWALPQSMRMLRSS